MFSKKNTNKVTESNFTGFQNEKSDDMISSDDSDWNTSKNTK